MKTAVISQAVTKGLDKNVKMKDSGVEWIGEVPEHWEVMKTLYSLEMRITDGPHETPQIFDDGIPFVSAEACSNGSIDFGKIRGFISPEYHEECCKKYRPQMYDVYMIKSGATTGRTTIVECDTEFSIWSPLAVFRVAKEITNPYYLLYSLRADYYQKQVELMWSYGTQQNIGMRVLEHLKIVLPPLDEQNIIVNVLQRELGTIDAEIAKHRKQIDLLKEYKTTLISNVVTGKLKVV